MKVKFKIGKKIFFTERYTSETGVYWITFVYNKVNNRAVFETLFFTENDITDRFGISDVIEMAYTI